jgi:hypothetical protein
MSSTQIWAGNTVHKRQSNDASDADGEAAQPESRQSPAAARQPVKAQAGAELPNLRNQHLWVLRPSRAAVWTRSQIHDNTSRGNPALSQQQTGNLIVMWIYPKETGKPVMQSAVLTTAVADT